MLTGLAIELPQYHILDPFHQLRLRLALATLGCQFCSQSILLVECHSWLEVHLVRPYDL